MIWGRAEDPFIADLLALVLRQAVAGTCGAPKGYDLTMETKGYIEGHVVYYYQRRGYEAYWGHPAPTYRHASSRFYENANRLVFMVRDMVKRRYDRPPKGKWTVPEWLLADVAVELGFGVRDVIELMGGRPYKF